MTKFVADLHIHSHYSRATSGDCNPENLHRWAAYKGLDLIGTGDFTHPAWREELRGKLEPAGEGLYRLKDEFRRTLARDDPRVVDADVRFMVTGEISSIYKKNGRVRKIHNLILLPDLEAAERISRRLEGIGNLNADGRPILGLDSRDLLEISLEECPEVLFIPAHIWTPHFSLYGANSGFDSIDECFEDLTSKVYALETGLSSDPPMNWRLSALDRFTLVSNSDAHSPRNLGREANLFATELSYSGVAAALKGKGEAGGFAGTIEFFPEEGKYHYDGHRNCKVRWSPSETKAAGGVCPVCGRRVTVGVLHRVEELADRKEGVRPAAAKPFYSLVPLPELIGDAIGKGPATKAVEEEYFKLIRRFGSELAVLQKAPLSEISEVSGPLIAEAVRRLRAGEVDIEPGFDGEYGKIEIIHNYEREGLKSPRGQMSFLASISTERGGKDGFAGVKTAGGPRGTAGEEKGDKKGEDHSGGEGVKESSAALDLLVSAEVGSWNAKKEARYGISDLLGSLNDEQREVVMAKDGPIMVIAGPGTGKTRTLTMRIAYLIKRGVDPRHITAVTFTNRAAAEVKARLEDLVGPQGDEVSVSVGTFHSISLEILRQVKGWKGGDEGRGQGASQGEARGHEVMILDEWDSLAILADLLRRREGASSMRKARKVARGISLLKSRAILPGDPGAPPSLRGIYGAYQEELVRFGAMDYDDILLETLRLFEEGEVSLEGIYPRFTHLLVDEFQDVNAVQYRLVRRWAHDPKNLFVIGDPDQAIYGFRGADYRFFAKMYQDFPHAKIFNLSINYRSTPQILKAASALIGSGAADPSPKVMGETMMAGRPLDGERLEEVLPRRGLQAIRPPGPRLRHIQVPTDLSEGIAIAHEIGRMVGGMDMLGAHGDGRAVKSKDLGIQDLTSQGRAGNEVARGEVGVGERSTRSFSEIAILFRTMGQMELMEECLIREGIPYRVIGKEGLLGEEGVRYVLAFLRSVAEPWDDFHHLMAVRNPSFCQDDTLLAKISLYAKERGLSVREAMREMVADKGPAAMGAPLEKGEKKSLPIIEFLDTIEKYTRIMNVEMPSKLISNLVEEGRRRGFLSEKDVGGVERLGRIAAGFSDLRTFLSRLSLSQEADLERTGRVAGGGEVVTLMTLHAAKGLEFPVVFIAGVEEGLIPLRRERGVIPGQSEVLDEREDSDPGEELRLFYVGLTRAQDELILVSSRRRTIYGQRREVEPSSFLRAIPPDCIEVEAVGLKEKARRVEQLSLF